MWESWARSPIGRFAAEEDDLVRWRRSQLLRAGFPADLADTLAADRFVDVHALIELVEHGCPPRLAVRILAPTGAEGEAR